jgi:hypothetical protein
MNRYIEYRKRGSQPLPPEEFGVLAADNSQASIMARHAPSASSS